MVATTFWEVTHIALSRYILTFTKAPPPSPTEFNRRSVLHWCGAGSTVCWGKALTPAYGPRSPYLALFHQPGYGASTFPALAFQEQIPLADDLSTVIDNRCRAWAMPTPYVAQELRSDMGGYGVPCLFRFIGRGRLHCAGFRWDCVEATSLPAADGGGFTQAIREQPIARAREGPAFQG